MYTTDQKREVLLNMVKALKAQHDLTNQNLVDNGDSKYTSPFESISVRDIKNYALSDLENVKGWEEF